MGRFVIVFFTLVVLNSSKAAAQLNLRLGTDSIPRQINLNVLPQNFYNQHAGFFCKKEAQLQKAASLPLYFRLGSKDYVDWMEKKPNALKRF